MSTVTKFRQAKWNEPIIFELTKISPEIDDATVKAVAKYLPEKWIRRSLYLPDISESVVIKHFTRLSQMNYSVDLGFYPLGSCTMKYNPKIDEYILTNELHWVHPEQPEETIQGLLKILYELGEYLKQITGFDCISLQPAAGAHGELAGALIIKKYHEVRGEKDRNEMLIPDSAHGTNPASAKMAGFKVVEIPSDERGLVDINALKSALGPTTAGMMLTNPNTLGLFERNIKLIAELVHNAGGLMYYDGANLNAIAGLVRPADLGFDICHLNLHKTFGSPHGGGGPGSGPVLVKRFLRSFLPVPIIERGDDGKYYFEWNLEHSIGKVHGYYGNIAVLLRAYAYILINGFEGLVNNSKLAVLNSNYLLRKLEKLRGVSIPYDPTQYRL
ncbi:MAG: aminomethyl-transferring glycine dehydrogenase subunit GcvPB, partial [Candidatus Geothermarchaeota archaeon]